MQSADGVVPSSLPQPGWRVMAMQASALCSPSPCASAPPCSSRSSNCPSPASRRRSSSPSCSGAAESSTKGFQSSALWFCLGWARCGTSCPHRRTPGSPECLPRRIRWCRCGTCVPRACCRPAPRWCWPCARRTGGRGCSSGTRACGSAGGRWRRSWGCPPRACRGRPGRWRIACWHLVSGSRCASGWAAYGCSGPTPARARVS